MRLLIALIVWTAAIAGAAEVSTVVAASIHQPPGAAGSAANGGTGSRSGSGGASLDPSSVKPTDSVSLFAPANFSRALAAARARLGARAQLDLVALYPGYLALTAVKAGGEVEVNIDAGGRLTVDNTGGSPGSSPLFRLGALAGNTPALLAHRIATSGHVPESQLNYMVVQVDPTGGHVRWLVYPRHGNRVEYFAAPGARGPLQELLSNSSTGLQPVRG